MKIIRPTSGKAPSKVQNEDEILTLTAATLPSFVIDFQIELLLFLATSKKNKNSEEE